HLLDQRVEAGLVSPPELGSRFARVAQEGIDLGWAKVTRVDFNEHLSRGAIDALLFDAGAPPDYGSTDMGERPRDEFSNRMALTGRQHVVVGLLLLKDQPHPFDVVTRMAPIPLGVEIAEKQLVLQPVLDCRDGTCDFAGYEGLPPDGAFMVKQDAVRSMYAVSLAVIYRDPMCVELRRRVRRTRVERGRFPLRDFLYLAEQLGRGSLIELGLVH